MANLQVKEKVNSFKKLQEVLQGGFKKELTQIGIYMEGSIKKNIDESVDINGNSFEPLSKYTISQRRKGNKSENEDQPLRDTGRLQNSYTHNVKENSVEIGTNVPYSRKVNFGDPDNKLITDDGGIVDAPIPARQHVGFSKKRNDRERVKQILIDSLRERFK